MDLSKEMTDLTYRVIGVCMEVHRELGPGFPEQYYQKALQFEFPERRIVAEAEKAFIMPYKHIQVGLNYLDFEIERKLILEIKSVNRLNEVHMFQVLKYLAVSNLPVALLVNFGNTKLEYRRVLPTSKWQEFRNRSKNKVNDVTAD
jgi:GxxExxY protein